MNADKIDYDKVCIFRYDVIVICNSAIHPEQKTIASNDLIFDYSDTSSNRASASLLYSEPMISFSSLAIHGTPSGRVLM